jgi:murein hydrolase activator
MTARRASPLRVLAALLSLALAQPAMADPAETARIAALQLLDAVEGLAMARTARDQVTALTRTIAAHETGLEALRIGLREVTLREAVIAQVFDAQSETVARLLSAMMAVQRVEGPALLLHPAGPLGTARAGMLIADLAPAMQAEADRMAALLSELRDLRALRGDAMQTLSDALTSLQEARAELGQAIAERRTPPPPIGQDEARLLALLASAQTLETLSAGLASIPALDGVGPSGFAQARGDLPLPARATVLRRAGEADAAGTVRPGLVLATEPGALVTAPWDGTLRYRGPLLDYGNVILLEPDEGYLILIAGLETVYPRPGEIVVAGGPLGLMPGGVDPGTEFAARTPASAGRSLSLYVELRYRGQTIDPADWFDLTATMP